jgi:hypothetical protein
MIKYPTPVRFELVFSCSLAGDSTTRPPQPARQWQGWTVKHLWKVSHPKPCQVNSMTWKADMNLPVLHIGSLWSVLEHAPSSDIWDVIVLHYIVSWQTPYPCLVCNQYDNSLRMQPSWFSTKAATVSTTLSLWISSFCMLWLTLPELHWCSIQLSVNFVYQRNQTMTVLFFVNKFFNKFSVLFSQHFC